MKNRAEIFCALNNAVGAIVTHSGADREIALQAVCEIQHLESQDFTDHSEVSYFEQIHELNNELQAQSISNEDLRRLFANFWALYKSVEKDRSSVQ